MTVNPLLILRDEPIRRGRGKPHLVAELHRTGGEVVYVCLRRSNGVSEPAYKALLAKNPKAAVCGWTEMRRNAGVYARRTVRHADHATVTLPCWHQVLMNTENETPTMANVAFLN